MDAPIQWRGNVLLFKSAALGLAIRYTNQRQSERARVQFVMYLEGGSGIWCCKNEIPLWQRQETRDKKDTRSESFSRGGLSGAE